MEHMPYPGHVLAFAEEWQNRSLYHFNDIERLALRQFFTNDDRSVFLMHSLPESIGTSLLAMFSRLKNPRGIRGMFVDSLLPQILAAHTAEAQGYNSAQAFLSERRITTLEEFMSYSPATRAAYEVFRKKMMIDPEYLEQFVDAPRIKQFLGLFLDKFGHNSIARPARLWICAEQVSLLAAKTFEWVRPGSGFIELSTRYVDMGGKDVYPIAREFELLAPGSEGITSEMIDRCFGVYRDLQGDGFAGPFPEFLRDTYGRFYRNDHGDLENGVIGETCDVVGNFLPACTLTSVGGGVSGEALQQMLQHLSLDCTPENLAIRRAIIQEGSKTGASQFIRHYDPTQWKRVHWEYLTPHYVPFTADLTPRELAERTLVRGFCAQDRFSSCRTMEDVVAMLKKIPRGEYDKLPNHFERVAAAFEGLVSFRGWRDMQRHTYSTHYRSLLTPYLGFYEYDKPSPEVWRNAVRRVVIASRAGYETLRRSGALHPIHLQYALSLGFLVRYQMSGNLGQHEFCGWQRSKPDVNHEVRKEFLKVDAVLCKEYPWWREVVRTNCASGYAFARTRRPLLLSEVV